MKLLFILFLIYPLACFGSSAFVGGGNTLGLSCTSGQVPSWSGAGFTSCLTASGSGTVTSAGVITDSTTDSIFAQSSHNITGSPVTASGNMTLTLSNQNKNLVLASPSSGSAAAPAFRALVGADLPNPASSTLGGVQSAASVSHQWINSISTSGVPNLTQPAFTDISGTASGAQLPSFTGDVTNSGAAMTVAAIAGTTVSGTTGTGNVLFQTGFVEEWTGHIETVSNKTYYVVPYSQLGRKVVSIRIACGTSGTVTAALQIGGTNITTCNGISVTSTPGTTTCDTGSTSTLAANGQLTLVTTSNSSCLDLYYDVKTTRQ